MEDYPQALEESRLWRAVIPLINFEVVEWYRPDRIMRQFGLRQTVPMPCDTNVALHSLDRRGRLTRTDWSAQHAGIIVLWEQQWQHVIEREPSSGVMRVDDPYMIWYKAITRCYITDPMSGEPSRPGCVQVSTWGSKLCCTRLIVPTL